MPSELIYTNLPLPAGNYELEMRSGFLNGFYIRTGNFGYV